MKQLYTPLLVLCALLSGCNLFAGISTGPDTGFGSEPDATSDAELDDAAIPTDANGPADTSSGDVSPDGAVDAGCLPEPPEEFCRRLGKDCEVVQGMDNCGEPRLVDCGDCADDDCGESEPNVCGCPCDIDGECWLDGQPSPEGPCFVCDPATATDAFTINAGGACDDDNACTGESVCDDEGTCVPVDFDGCESEAGECEMGICDEQSQSCIFEALPDDSECPDDGLACTADFCVDGVCEHDTMDGFCLIAGTCYQDGAPDPSNPCAACDVQQSTTSFTIRTGAACSDADGLDCTGGVCQSDGTCDPELRQGFCNVAGTCYEAGETAPDDGCMVCDPAQDTTALVAADDMTPCDDQDGLACTGGFCESGVCEPALLGGNCLIDGVCYSDGEQDPADDCSICDASFRSTSWTPASDGSSCATSLPCTFGECVAGMCEETVDAASCLISNACFANGEFNPVNDCEMCESSVSQTDWTDAPLDTPCGGSPSCGCSAGVCEDNQGDLCPTDEALSSTRSV